MGPRAGLDGCRKSRPPQGFDPRTVQSVASRYTDLAIPVNGKGGSSKSKCGLFLQIRIQNTTNGTEQGPF